VELTSDISFMGLCPYNDYISSMFSEWISKKNLPSIGRSSSSLVSSSILEQDILDHEIIKTVSGVTVSNSRRFYRSAASRKGEGTKMVTSS
jgi:hypothetical protein